MELYEFRNLTLEEIKLTAEVDGSSDKEEFMNSFAVALLDAEEISDFTYLPFEGIGKGRRKIQIDGFSYDELDNCLSLFVCPTIVYPESKTLTNTEAETLFSRAKAFIEDSDIILKSWEDSSPGYGLALDIQNRYKNNVTKYKFYIFTDMQMSRGIKEIPEDLVDGKPTEYNIWDIERWYQLAASKTGKEDIVIDLTEFIPAGIPCLRASETGEYTAYLCNIPGKILADLYNRYGGRLLEGNVRSFLTVRGKVNKGIRNTILNTPEMFFAYNNGIAATAYGVQTITSNHGLNLTSITALQIVNGGQTTASLAMAMINDRDRAQNLENIFVPMKLSVVSPEMAEELIPNISRYANSQNSVSSADFFSNHPFHIRIEELSRRLLAPAVAGHQYGTRWYYERAKGQYQQEQAKLTVAKRTQFLAKNPKNQKFTKTDLAKYMNLYYQIPHIVSCGAQKNFLKFAERIDSEWNKNDTSFNEGYYRQLISLAIVFKYTDHMVKNQPWYESGYKAQVVAYTISMLFYLTNIKCQNHAFPFNEIWQKQSPGLGVQEQLIIIAEHIFRHLTNPEREIQNVTEWAKREQCWQKAKEIEIKLLTQYTSELVGRHDAEYEDKTEQQKQRLTNKVNAMVDVADYGADSWRDLIDWCTKQGILSPVEMSILKTTRHMDKGQFPSEKQCAKILQIREKAREESYPN